jgi:regulator of protease activity HflC (stomatin/prohibitin superfamily)
MQRTVDLASGMLAGVREVGAMSRTGIAFILLFVGVIALLILRYYPWVYADAVANPLVTVILVGVAAALVGNFLLHRVPDPKRAVVFRDERFDRIEPRGAFTLLPGAERIGAEILLDEQLVTGAPITVLDKDGKDHMVIIALTWRLVPSALRPDDERERRVLLMTDGERRLIVLQTLERIVRDIARTMSLAELTQVILDPDCIEAIRSGLNARLDDDALTVDRLHVQRIISREEKKDDSVVAREWRRVEETRTGEARGQPAATSSQARTCCPHGYLHDCPYGCLHPCAHGYARGCPHGCAEHTSHRACQCQGRCQCNGQRGGSCECSCQWNGTQTRTIIRTEESIRGASVPPEDWKPPKKDQDKDKDKEKHKGKK